MDDNTSTKLGFLIKCIGLIAIFSGIFGVSYQKGMIMTMNLGNLNGNYDIREIFNTAIIGYFEILTQFFDVDFVDVFMKNMYIAAVFAAFGLLLPGLLKLIKYLSKEETKETIRSKFDGAIHSWWVSGLIGLLIGFIANLLTAVFSFFIMFSLGVMLLPALIGYAMGAAKITKAMYTEKCTEVTSKMLERPFLRQCLTIKINGREIVGDIVLENSDAYFIHLKQSFLYLRKDGSTCIYSKFLKSEDVKDKDSFRFEKNVIDELCKGAETTEKRPSLEA